MTALIAAALLIVGILALTTTLIGKIFLATVAIVTGVLLLAGIMTNGGIRLKR